MMTKDASKAAAGRWIAGAVLLGAAAAASPHVARPWPAAVGEAARATAAPVPAIGMPGAPATSPENLRVRIDAMEGRLRASSSDAQAAIMLADALLRQARATGEGRHANRAAEVLEAVLAADPGHYDALRLLGAIQLSRHRFRDALDVGRRARDARPGDAWNYGVIGDALIELGDYDAAFDAFDRMASLRPGPDSYARVSYARELRGDLPGALEAMQMAADATSAHDAEAKAWHSSQVGELLLKMARPAEAEREFRRAAFFFPAYPHAMTGLGKARLARGDADGALTIFSEQLQRTPTLDLAARVGDLYAARGDRQAAEHYYELAENLAGPPAVQSEPALALFLAERDRKPALALQTARAVAAVRHDIFTDDALAWALFRNGLLEEAREASARALRTGTRDERILAHAAALRSTTVAER